MVCCVPNPAITLDSHRTGHHHELPEGKFLFPICHPGPQHGPNPLKLCEELLACADIACGSVVLGLGSGAGLTSALIARECGFAAYAADLWSDPGDNMRFFDWLGLVPIAVGLGFAALGAAQLVKRRSLLRVDPDILLLSVYYIAVIFFYLIFEIVPVNYRPIPIDGVMEASYPSSTALLVLSVMPPFSMTPVRG